jgi:preprotein translocase subunit SecD
MTFHLVDESVSMADMLAGRVPPGTKLVYERDRTGSGQRQPLVIQEQAIITGDQLQRASGGFDGQSGQPIVSFTFDMSGARTFASVTSDNIGRRFAVVLDEEVITAPVIRSPIIGGQGQIEGGFTTKTANDLAVMLNAGALPAEISVEEQRVVSAELGADSVQQGQYAAVAGLVLVVIFMLIAYGRFGIYANIALVSNLVLLAGLFTIFQITLTLPGIAAFVLTMGMAVDANVLIFERIREERRMGRGLISSIDAGFERAMATIIDSNLTTLLAGLILIATATGTVRGFGVALSLGIVTSVFTAIWVTRLCVVWWLRSNPKELNL